MSYRKKIKTFLSPFAIRIFLALKNFIGLYEWKFVGYEWKAEFNPSGVGWDKDDIPLLQKQKWPHYKKVIQSTEPLGINHEDQIPYKTDDIVFHNMIMSFAYTAALPLIKNKEIKFLDWGGGIGHYGLLIKNLFADAHIDYHCFDLPSYCKIGSEIWNKEATFSSDKEQLLVPNYYDLVMASSSIWYEPDWKAIFKRLLDSTKAYLYITRMIFTKDAKSFVAIQRPSYMGHKTQYYFWAINEEEFKQYSVSCGARLVREFILTEPVRIYKAPGKLRFKGFLLKKNL